jgi:hypothetical protein
VRERAFNAQPWEVRAILAGTKTQIRRPVKLPSFDRVTRIIPSDGAVDLWDAKDERGATPAARMVWHSITCPYGVPGDRLWVRETFAVESNGYLGSAEEYPPPFNDGRPIDWEDTGEEAGRIWWQPHYRATDPPPEFAYEGECDCDKDDPHVHWKPSIHMPRWASRLTLEVTDVRGQRLQEISREDAIAEGLEWAAPTFGVYGLATSWNADPRESYRALWDSINGKRAPWDSNPFVWAVSFRTVARG